MFSKYNVKIDIIKGDYVHVFTIGILSKFKHSNLLQCEHSSRYMYNNEVMSGYRYNYAAACRAVVRDYKLKREDFLLLIG